MKSLTKFIIFSFAALIAYTIVSQIVAIKTGIELSTLTTCFFAAFGGEVLSCALIKIFKLKGGQDNADSDSTVNNYIGTDGTDNGSNKEDAS